MESGTPEGREAGTILDRMKAIEEGIGEIAGDKNNHGVTWHNGFGQVPDVKKENLQYLQLLEEMVTWISENRGRFGQFNGCTILIPGSSDSDVIPCISITNREDVSRNVDWVYAESFQHGLVAALASLEDGA